MRAENIVQMITEAWPVEDTPFRIIDSHEGDEPNLLAQEFKNRPRWDSLTPEFLDSTPDGFASALSFFGDEAFRYYIAAYMKADLKRQLQCVDPVFSLTHGLTDDETKKHVNPRRFGEQTWFHVKQAQFSLFNVEQVQCIVEYLKHRAPMFPWSDDGKRIGQAIANYWEPRLRELTCA